MNIDLGGSILFRAKKISVRFISFVTIVVLALAVLPMSVNADIMKGKITAFELSGEVFNETAVLGTESEDLSLPESIRAIIELPEGKSSGDFKQARANRDGNNGYYTRGYSLPDNAEDLYKDGKQVVYKFVGTDGETQYRVYGSIDGENNTWYASDKNGKVSGEVIDLSVKWVCQNYKKDVKGDYYFTAVFANYTYALSHPYGVLHLVKKATQTQSAPAAQDVPSPDYTSGKSDCSCGIDSDSEAYEHLESCEKFGNACTCAGGVHDTGNISCPLYAVEQSAEKSNGKAMLSFIQQNSRTSGSEAYMSVFTGDITSSDRINDINSYFMNDTMGAFSWSDAKGAPVWSGSEANTTQSAASESSSRIPSHKDGVWTVYSGEQLAYALAHCVGGQTVQLANDIDLNGVTANWEAIGAGNKAITLLGEGHTIYNLGVYDEDGGFGGFIVNGGYLTVKDLTFDCAVIVSEKDAGLFYSVGGDVVLENVHVLNSLFYTAEGVASPLGAFCGKADVKNCSVENTSVYGGDCVSGFAYLLGTQGATVSECGVSGGKLYAKGPRAAGFTAGQNGAADYVSCYAETDIKAVSDAAGFAVSKDVTAESCFASGKLSASDNIAGFILFSEDSAGSFKNCFTTLLAEGENGVEQGGFACTPGTIKTTAEFENCYAAGSVGYKKLDMSEPQSIGGFINKAENFTAAKFANCFYDMYATGMRDWAAGDSNAAEGITAATAFSSNADIKSMARGEDIGLGEAFAYTEGAYPTLTALSNNETMNKAAEPVNYKDFGVDRRSDLGEAEKDFLNIMKYIFVRTGYAQLFDIG